ncbi:TSUP family transporter [Gordonia sp. HNM0687]|uniref:Probable membrane transporter protein n=1 Tax=Gordonia mangrovi TaxID=2665643 RepID=A0A6L7GUV6_9ACTN|nr:TSUP family transporter [Gordonia mangrovi]MXP23749.1 TSUP family transporter [Gordonia mangrovi]UVF79805.1 TSUP family transporter [Gordonia mangrovi]
MELAALLAAAAAAGWVDAVVGGGGLVLIPALMIVQPGLAPATALGTNKLAAVFGTASAAVAFARRLTIDLRRLAPVFISAVVFSGLGAYTASRLPADVFTPVVLGLLIAVGLFVALNPGFGSGLARQRPRWSVLLGLVLAGVVIAFYDGVMGPGTGTFLIISLTALVGTGFLESSGMAKVINTGTNLGALAVFAWQGNVLWLLGLALAAANIAGAQLGAHMAIGRGSGFVRWVLLAVVVVMVGKLGYDMVTG